MTERWRGYHVFDKLHANEISGGPIFAELGETYYVNNITGNSGNTGLSWAQAFAEVDQALSAAETLRALKAAGNQNIRNRIIIQATNTPYDNVDEAIFWADIIGVGSPSRGNGQGVVVITNGAGEDVWAQTDYYGNLMYNISLLNTIDAYWCQDLTLVVQSVWDNVAFTTNKAGDMSSGGGLRATTALGGCIIRNCVFNTQGSGQLYEGLNITGPNNNNEIAYNHINAAQYGLHIQGTDTNTVIHDNWIYSGRATQMAVGIACKTHSLVTHNFISAVDAISGATANNTIDNQVVQDGTAARELA
jgi:hypothetical protein